MDRFAGGKDDRVGAVPPTSVATRYLLFKPVIAFASLKRGRIVAAVGDAERHAAP
jgi:hypothetical protein